MTVEAAGVCSSIWCMVLLVLQLLVVFCNQLETAAQNESSSVIIPSAVEIVTVSLIPSVSETTTNMTINDITNQTASITVPIVLTIATSPDINPVTSMDVFTLTDMISSSDIMVTSQLSVDTTMSSFIITITTAEISPVHTIDTSTMAVMTTVVMASSSVMPMTTAVVITTSNPVPVPEGDSSGFSTGVIVGIAAGGGGAALVIILMIALCCGCCCCCQRHHQQKAIPMVMSPTIQVRPEEYGYWVYTSQRSNASQRSNSSQGSNISQLSKISKSIRVSLRRNKDKKQFEGVKLISTTVLSTPV